MKSLETLICRRSVCSSVMCVLTALCVQVRYIADRTGAINTRPALTRTMREEIHDQG
jgi:hypothetical protein